MKEQNSKTGKQQRIGKEWKQVLRQRGKQAAVGQAMLTCFWTTTSQNTPIQLYRHQKNTRQQSSDEEEGVLDTTNENSAIRLDEEMTKD